MRHRPCISLDGDRDSDRYAWTWRRGGFNPNSVEGLDVAARVTKSSAPGVPSLSYLKTVRRRWSEAAVQQSVRRILGENVLCSMSTIGPRNRPHINSAYFCYSLSLEIFFLSDAGSAHCRNLDRSPSMAMAVFRSTQTWGGSDRGLQLFGTCTRAVGPLARRAAQIYGKRFPRYARFVASTSGSAKRAADQLRSYTFYRFVPRTVKILDEREFGGAVFVVVSVPRP